MLSSGWLTRRTPAALRADDVAASGAHRAKRWTSRVPVAPASKPITSTSVHSDCAKSGRTTPAANRELPHPAATMTMRESSAGWAASKSITAALTLAARCGSVWAWRVAPLIEDCGPAVKTAPAPMRYSSMATLSHLGVPTGWPSKNAFPQKEKRRRLFAAPPAHDLGCGGSLNRISIRRGRVGVRVVVLERVGTRTSCYPGLCQS